jgi:hypothetical protein
MAERVQIRTITDPREKLKAEMEEIEAGNQRTRDEIARLQELLKGGLEAASKIKDQLRPIAEATPSKLEVTKADREAYAKLPDGWFEWFDIPTVIRCPEFRLKRLVERGMAEDRIEGKYPDITRLYRKIRSNPNEQWGDSGMDQR